MQCVSRIVQCVAEQPVVGLIQQLLKVRQIRRAVFATFAASQERVDSFKVRRRCEASPRGPLIFNLVKIFIYRYGMLAYEY